MIRPYIIRWRDMTRCCWIQRTDVTRHYIILWGDFNRRPWIWLAVIVRYVMFSNRVNRGPMQMVQHHVIYSPERKNNSHDHDTCNHTHTKHKYCIIKCLPTLFTADPLSLCPNGLFFFFFLHVVPVFAGLHLPFLLPLRWAGPSLAPSL